VDVIDRQTGKSARCGIIALQLHAGRPMKVQFRDIRLHQFANAPNRTERVGHGVASRCRRAE
jgi:hypothetical protein